MKFLARWGNACGTPFKKTEFCDKHIQWEYQRSFLEDRDRQPWVFCSGVNMKEPVEKIEKAIEADPDKTGDGGGSDSIPPSPSSPQLRTPEAASPLRSSISMASSKLKPNTPTPAPTPTPRPTPKKPHKPRIVKPIVNIPQQNQQINQQPTSDSHNLHSEHINDHHQHHLLPSIYSGGSIITDNNKEMKEFMKMLKTKSGSKSKAKNTRRNKHNKSK
jgi:hypothetical protein